MLFQPQAASLRQVGGLMDNLSYDYGMGTAASNKLMKVTDGGDATKGFKDGNTAGNDYDYDANGSMTVDKNKGITSITYNHLNLPRVVKKSGADSIVYTYDAGGRKLRQQVYGATAKITDYAGEYIYENDTLRFINHEEGRIIPEGNEYQYHLKDHLGNVRMTFTTKRETAQATATLETANTAAEQSEFIYYNEAIKVNSVLFDHTNSGATNYTTRLVGGNTNSKYGLAKSLSVMPGDTLNIEVYAKYLDTNSSNWTAALTTFMAAIANGTAPAGTFVDGGAAGSTGTQTMPYIGTLQRANDTGTGPKGYLNYILFDRNFVYQTGGFMRLTTAARETGTDVAHERLYFDNLVIKEPGYIYIYLSNENETNVEVYFDDFTVEHIKSPVVQQDDYYAFGLTFNSYQRENAKKNKYLYNGGAERQDDLDLGIDLTFYRAYDPSMCRWWQIDPKVDNMEGWTPYNYSFNNPIRYNDPKGDCPPGVDCENFVKGAWNSVKAVGQFAADTWNSKGQNLVDAANNLEMVATVCNVLLYLVGVLRFCKALITRGAITNTITKQQVSQPAVLYFEGLVLK